MDRNACLSTSSACPSNPRIASGSTSGTASRNANFAWVSAWIGSSRVHPQLCRANDAGGTTSVRVPAACSSSHWPAATQSWETSVQVPSGSRRSDHAGATATTAASVMPTALGRFTFAAACPAPSASGR